MLNIECGGILSNTSGVIVSPGYNNGTNYTNNLECIWIVQNPRVGVNSSLALGMQDIRLEQHSECRWDVLEIREGRKQRKNTFLL